MTASTMAARNVVVGSGPSAVACTRALLDRGEPVVMIDAGLTLEPPIARRVAEMATTPVPGWRDQLRDLGGVRARPSYRGLPEKLLFGSDFPFRHLEAAGKVRQDAADTLWSYAAGGLSNVWGANTLPFPDADLDGWPFGVSTLAEYYAEVLRYVPLAGAHDELQALLPLYTDSLQPLRPSPQAAALLARWRASARALDAAGVQFGQSRLAVRAGRDTSSAGCVYCGGCLYGCPSHVIWSSAHELPRLLAQDAFSYTSGVVVDRVVQAGALVEVTGRTIGSQEPFRCTAERVFVGCGAVNSTRLALHSRGWHDQEVLLRDSQYFMIPGLMPRSVRRAREQASHSLSQLCLEVLDPAISTRHVHLLVYTINDLFVRALDALPGVARLALAPFRDALLDRLVVVQGYLHSQDSASIGLTVHRDGTSTLHGRRQAHTPQVVQRVIDKLHRLRPMTGILPLGFMHQLGLPGKSYHVGGSLPMRQAPGRLETDLLGRMPDMDRVHFIDPATFPSMPAANSTLTAMANAARIAAQVSGR